MNKEIEKAIEFIKSYAVSSGFTAEEKGYFKSAITSLEAEKEGLWIPVYKKLPDSDCMCKVIIFDDWTKKIFETEVKFEIRFKVAEGNYVVALKPLDEPWKEEQ